MFRASCPVTAVVGLITLLNRSLPITVDDHPWELKSLWRASSWVRMERLLYDRRPTTQCNAILLLILLTLAQLLCVHNI